MQKVRKVLFRAAGGQALQWSGRSNQETWHDPCEGAGQQVEVTTWCRAGRGHWETWAWVMLRGWCQILPGIAVWGHDWQDSGWYEVKDCKRPHCVLWGDSAVKVTRCELLEGKGQHPDYQDPLQQAAEWGRYKAAGPHSWLEGPIHVHDWIFDQWESQALERFITQHEEEVKLEKLKATFQESKKAADDTLIGFS